MSGVSHTPGPWQLGGNTIDWYAQPESGDAHCYTTQPIGASDRADPICLVVQTDKDGYRSDDAELDANAHLIAAAPDMLAALKLISGMDIYHEALAAVDAAIAKAEGRS